MEVLGFQSRDWRLLNLSFSFERTQRDIGHGAGRTHMDGTQLPAGTALPAGGPRMQAHAAPPVRFLSRPVGGGGERLSAARKDLPALRALHEGIREATRTGPVPGDA